MSTTGGEAACVHKELQKTITHGLELVTRSFDLYGCGATASIQIMVTACAHDIGTAINSYLAPILLDTHTSLQSVFISCPVFV
jgi:hypothetical protein